MSPEMDDKIIGHSFDEGCGVSNGESNQDDSCVHVAVRIRPSSPTPSDGNRLRLVSQEVDDDQFVILPVASEISNCEPSISANKFQTIQVGEENKSVKEYSFDHVFPDKTNQGELYSKCVNSLVNCCLEGYNATIFAYGQTGSGKTHTMIGDLGQQNDEAGVIPRALEDIFNGLEQKAESQKLEMSSPGSPHPQHRRSSSKPPFEYQVQVQFLELYGEEIHDLVGEDGIDQSFDREVSSKRRGRQKSGKIARRLTIRDGKVGEDAEVIGASSVSVLSAEDAINSLRLGTKLRRTEQTSMNSESSRSHAIFTLVIQQTQRKTSVMEAKESMEMKTSKIHFVDLAGSERIKSAKTKGKRMQEGININKGLFVLGNVISALGNGKKATHVPYRDSKLTRLLKGSLGGNHKTLMIACVRDSDNDESINTLRYANRAKNIMNHAKVNIDPSSRVINLLRNQVAALASECLRLRENFGDGDGDDDGFSSDLLNNFIRNTPPSRKKSSAVSFKARPSTAPTWSCTPYTTTPTRPSTAPNTATGQFSVNYLKRSRSDSCLDSVIALPIGSIDKFVNRGEGSRNIFEKLADDHTNGIKPSALFDVIRTHLRQTLDVAKIENDNNLSDIGCDQIHNRKTIEKVCETLKTLDMVAAARTIKDDEGVVAHEDEQIVVYDNICTSLRMVLEVEKPIEEWDIRLTSNRTPPGVDYFPSKPYKYPLTSSTRATPASENEHEFSTNSRNTSMEGTLYDILVPEHENLGNAITDYQTSYQILKMKNKVNIIDTQAKNYAKEKEFLESIKSKLNENSVESMEISRSVTLIDTHITVLNKERHGILGSKIYIKHQKTLALELESETYSLSDAASSLGEIVSDLEARGKMSLGSEDAPIPSILNLNKSHSSNHSNECVPNDSNKKCRKIILRYGTFIMRRFLPLLGTKRKDDTLPYPLRL